MHRLCRPSDRVDSARREPGRPLKTPEPGAGWTGLRRSNPGTHIAHCPTAELGRQVGAIDQGIESLLVRGNGFCRSCPVLQEGLFLVGSVPCEGVQRRRCRVGPRHSPAQRHRHVPPRDRAEAAATSDGAASAKRISPAALRGGGTAQPHAAAGELYRAGDWPTAQSHAFRLAVWLRQTARPHGPRCWTSTGLAALGGLPVLWYASTRRTS
jgi:hypothetical protein